MVNRNTPLQRHPMSHISIDDSIQQQQSLLQADTEALEELDAFYQAMLEEFDPALQKRRYQTLLDKRSAASIASRVFLSLYAIVTGRWTALIP